MAMDQLLVLLVSFVYVVDACGPDPQHDQTVYCNSQYGKFAVSIVNKFTFYKSYVPWPKSLGKTPYVSHSCSLGNDNFVICYQTSISVCNFNSMELPIKQRNSLNLKQFQYKAPTYLVAKKSIQCMLVSFFIFGLTLQMKTTFAKVGLVYFLTFY